MGYDRNDPSLTCGERDDRCAELGLDPLHVGDDPFDVIAQLIAPITMSDIRLSAGEGKLSAHDVLAAANAVLRLRAGRFR